MYARSLKHQKHSFFLLGPRGTGKSTWLAQFFPQAKVINLLDESLYQSYLADISLFYDSLKLLKPHSWVVVDEIQRLPNLLNEVHRLIEKQKLRFALTGSSARKLRKSGVNLLAGRAHRYYMYPFTPKELGQDFNLDQALCYGTIPLIQAQGDKLSALNSYVQMYLKEEIKAEALVRNLPGFVRFLPVLALYHGQIINTSSTARDAEVSRTTVNGFIEVLEDTLLLNKLPAYEARLRVREKKHPKIYWMDPGIVRTARKRTGPVTIEEKGSLFEGYVYMCLKVKMEYESAFDEISYWSSGTAKNIEVDFLLQNGSEFIAIEVKTTKKVKAEDLKGLKVISDLKGVKRRIFVYLGTTQMEKDGIEIMPFTVFCKKFLTV
ncbi:MAG: ATP-binding protein [Bdellovibrionales bacterium]|nr:ATP-binding protein [Bdellovibrionales bacterium]